MDACQKYGRNSSAFDRVCEEAVESVTNPQPLYDVILVDEAQDFSKYFLQMCYMSLPHESRMLVYAYDELQSLDNKNVESPEDIFGYSNGRPNVVLDNSNGKAEDIVLSKCYRNSRPVLITAHSLGFGIYRKKEAREETSLVQLFEDKQLWEDIGYTVKEGVIRDGEFVTLYRTEETSPAFLEDHSSIDDLIQFPCLRSASGQGLQPLIRSNIALLQCVLWCLSGDRHRGHIGNRRHFPDRYRGHIGSRTAGRHCCQRGCFAMRV